MQRHILNLILFVMTVSIAFAVPQQVNYQGFLTATDGSPLDTTVAMTFKIYTDSTAGSLLWTEARPSVTITDGLFNVRLGQITTLGDAVFNNAQVWLGITVGNNSEMTPRSRVVSVGYSYRVGTVDGASGGAITSAVTIADKANIGQYNSNPGLNAFVAGAYDTASGDYSTVGGGFDNTASYWYATVGGGGANVASGQAATVGGGSSNTATAWTATVGGGVGNTASDYHATVSGGSGNTASRAATVGGGESNAASGSWATVGGGISNTASMYATVGGGSYNTASAPFAVSCGGGNNAATAGFATVGGGQNNNASSDRATVGGGDGNTAGGSAATVSGGSHNAARGQYSVVAGGGGPALADSNSATGDKSTIGGGSRNIASNTWATIGGGKTNNASGASATVGGGENNTATDYATVGGGASNTASGDHATVGGGRFNHARGDYAVVAGGGGASLADSNSATGDYSAIGGGAKNTASGNYATVGGGHINDASGDRATVGGGYSNVASDFCAVVPGGYNNTASARYAFAAGRNANADNVGSFVWADSTNTLFSSMANNQFRVRASGGTQIYSNSTLTSGVTLAAGAGAWVAVSDSTLKRNLRLVDTKDVLNRVAQLPIKQWSYKSQDPSIEHIGPMAQDFWSAFHLGEDSLGISTIDPDGIALAAIQELAKRLEAVEVENTALRARVQTLEAAEQKTMKEGK